jgi:hypothetical protein
MKELGIGYAILAHSLRPKKTWIQNPNYTPPNASALGGAIPGAVAPGGLGGIGAAPFGGVTSEGGGGGPIVPQDPNNPEYFQVINYEFVVQFVWQEKPLLVRLEERKKAEEAAKAAAEAAAAAAASGEPGAAPPPPVETPAAPVAEGTVPANDPGLQLPEEGVAPPAPAPAVAGGQVAPGATAPGAASSPTGPAPSVPTPATPPMPRGVNTMDKIKPQLRRSSNIRSG